MSFLHKKLDEEDRKQIKEDVKKIVESFGDVLNSLENLPEEGFIQRESSFREEKKEFFKDLNFRERVFKNSKNKNKNFLIAEKKKW
jgi:Asp-tRNA(Asn)/Glu-tRNA(Gln) amidotransferase C subunit